LCAQEVINLRQGIIDAYTLHSFSTDLTKANQSEIRPHISAFHYSLNEPADYLLLSLPTQAIKFVAQCRLALGKTYFRIHDTSIILDQDAKCTICTMYVTNSIYHQLFQCPLNIGARNAFLQGNKCPQEYEWWASLEFKDKLKVMRFARFLSTCLMSYADIPYS